MLQRDLKEFNDRYMQRVVDIVHNDPEYAMNFYHLSPSFCASVIAVGKQPILRFSHHSVVALGKLRNNPDELQAMTFSKKKPSSIEFAPLNLEYLTLLRNFAQRDPSEAISRLNLSRKAVLFIRNTSASEVQSIARNAPYSLVACVIPEKVIPKLSDLHESLLGTFSKLSLTDTGL